MNKICGIYKITNVITGDFYIGSSKNVKQRWAAHKWPSTWKRFPNSQLYKDIKKYGVDKFEFQVLEEVEVEHLKEAEQQFIEKLQPTYNNINAKGIDIERKKETNRNYHKSKKYKEYNKEYQKSEKRKEYNKQYEKSEKRKEYNKEREKSEKRKEYKKEYNKQYEKSDKRKQYKKEYEKSDKRKKCKKQYDNQLCLYNNETLTLCALRQRLKSQGFDHPTEEAKKYLL